MKEDNRPYWIFTFGTGQKNAGKYVKIYGHFEEARNKMVDRYGLEWAFQYSMTEWRDWIREAGEMGYPVETELEVIL